ncbi:hypothetical protein [Spirosoma rhododendri]|uniref:Tissue inhibitor of metalloproteinase n=1 Tax=Spirosoma rhododendri TaxID=2728024 RepID=A0A7L5DRN2_9BACT|nr:hypothetical protein [Spirosoma rhododendri]QJD79893.1 hypothetical protein HH216_16830 [Spirosoma rhododendri]
MKFSYPTFAIAFLLSTTSIVTYACGCVRNPTWTLKDELNSSSLAVKGKVISVTDYIAPEFPWPQKLFRLVIKNKYKSPVNTPDTVSIITGQDGADCGYAFKIGKEYIVYATNWEQKDTIRKVIKESILDMFYTSICTLTKETNRKELVRLNRLTH